MKANTLLILGVISGVLCAVMLGLGIFTAAFLDGILVTKAAEQTALKPDSYDKWGQVPGSTGVNVTRNFIFYNFTNAFEAFWFNATPVFAQMPGELYQESQNFLNTTYDNANPDDATHVNYGYQLRLNGLNAPNNTVTTLNVGPLGFWYSAQKLPPYQIGFYGLVTVIQQLSSQLIPTIQAGGLLSQYLLTSANTATVLLAPIGITETARQDFMWNDPIFGLGNPATLAQWIPAIIGGPDSDAAYAIQDNFYLTYAQSAILFDNSTGTLFTWLTNVNTVIQTTYGCGASCDGTYLFLKQWTTQGVTKNPPSGPVNANPYFPASDSVAALNPSVAGYIEISNFLTNYFIVNEDVTKADYENLVFTPELAASLLNITDSGGNYHVNTEPTSLVNIGNLATIYAYGELFDATKQTSDLSLLTPIANQFNLPSVQHAFVVWKYLQYFEQESVVLQSNHGTVADLIAGQIFVTTFDLLYTLLTIGPFPGELKQRVIYNFTAAAQTTCAGVLQVSTTLTAAQIATVCASGAFSAWDEATMGTLYTACQRQNYTTTQSLFTADFTLDQLGKLCTTTGAGTFYSYISAAETYMKNAYNCSTGLTTVNKCSNRELIVKQWGSSEITQNIPPVLQQYYTPALTIREWYPGLASFLYMFPLEYLAAIKQLGPNFNNDETLMAGLPYDLANQLFSTNALMNQVLVQNALIAFNTQNWPYIEQVFGSINPYNLISFIRFVVVEYAFQGFSQTRDISGLLWGYDDFFLGLLAGQPVYNSGDPSINAHVALAGKNCTGVNDTLFNATMYTGNSDRSLTRQFTSIDDITTVTYSNAYFDGSAVVTSLDSPWDQAIPLTGTDGNINPPGLDESDEIHVYLSDINYIAPLTYDSTHDYSGIDAYRFMLPESALQNVTNNPDNQQWYANKWNGLLNISKLQKAPLFISKGHFLDADPAMYQNIKVYNDSTLAFEATPGPGDDTYLDVEPYSGVSVGTMVRLQINYEYQPDSLLPNPNYSMMPILLTERGMNFTSDQIEDTFSDLKAGIKFKHIGIPVFFTLFVVFLGTTIFIFWKRRAMIKRGVVHDTKSPYHKFVEERESSGHNQSGPSPAGDGGDSRGDYAKEPYERA